jgi:hypothetical protein
LEGEKEKLKCKIQSSKLKAVNRVESRLMIYEAEKENSLSPS